MALSAIGAVPVAAGIPSIEIPIITWSGQSDGSGTDLSWPFLRQESGYDPALGDMVSRVSESEIYRTADELQAISTRVYPSDGNRQAAAYLHNRLAAIPGLSVEYQSDTYQNVIATLPGKDTASDRVIIVGAHYDSYSSDPARAPGATDNAGGAAIVLELARIMSAYQYDDTIKFAFWNAEETGMDGSAEYVAYASGNSLNIPLYLNFDGSCYDPKDRYVLDVMYNGESEPFADQMVRLNSLYGFDFRLTANAHDCGSDHESFWQGGYPAVSTHSLSHAPEGHSPEDTIELISTSYAKQNGQLGMALISETADLRV